MPEPTPVGEDPFELDAGHETVGLDGGDAVVLHASTSDPSNGDIHLYSHVRSVRYRIHGGEERLRVALNEADIGMDDYDGWSKPRKGPAGFFATILGSAWIGGRKPGRGKSKKNRTSPMARLNRRWGDTAIYVLSVEVNAEGAFVDLVFVRAADVRIVLEDRMGLKPNEYAPAYHRAVERYTVLHPADARRPAIALGGIEHQGKNREAAKEFLGRIEIPITLKRWTKAVAELKVYRIGPGSTAPFKLEVAFQGNRQNGWEVPDCDVPKLVEHFDQILLGLVAQYELTPIAKPTKWEPLLQTRASLAPRDTCTRRMRPSGWRGKRVSQADRALAWRCHTPLALFSPVTPREDGGIEAATRISTSSEVLSHPCSPSSVAVVEPVCDASPVDARHHVDGPHGHPLHLDPLHHHVLEDVLQPSGVETPDQGVRPQGVELCQGVDAEQGVRPEGVQLGTPRKGEGAQFISVLEHSDFTTYRRADAPVVVEAPPRRPVVSAGCPYEPIVDEIEVFSGLTEVVFSPYRDPGPFVQRVLERFGDRIGMGVLAPDLWDLYPHVRRLAREHPLQDHHEVVVLVVDPSAAAFVSVGFLDDGGAEEELGRALAELNESIEHAHRDEHEDVEHTVHLGPWRPGPFSEARGSFVDPDGTSAWWRALGALMADYTEQMRDLCEKTGQRVILVTQDARPVRGQGAWWASHESRDTRVRSILGDAARRSCHQRFYVEPSREGVRQVVLWRDELEGIVGRFVFLNTKTDPPWRRSRRGGQPEIRLVQDSEADRQQQDPRAHAPEAGGGIEQPAELDLHELEAMELPEDDPQPVYVTKYSAADLVPPESADMDDAMSFVTRSDPRPFGTEDT